MKIKNLSVLVFTLLLSLRSAIADSWNLPQVIDPGNSSVAFEVDSTWHLIEGVSKEFNGKIWLDSPNDFRSVHTKIQLPVRSLDTGNSSRDETMREVMHFDEHPMIEFETKGMLRGNCDPGPLRESVPCSDSIHGDLNINGITRPMILDLTLQKIKSDFVVDGTTVIRWADFKIDDPSILVAKLYDDVSIKIHLILKGKE